MTTLAPKLPYSHPFAGGYPRLGGQPLPTDPDAIDYLNRVAAADGAAVEVGVAMAVDAFIKGCKSDSAGYAGDPTRTVWDAIKACCIMCGARTISGALVPLKTPYGPELVSIDALPTPTIVDFGGSTSSWDASTRTMTNATYGSDPGYPRFRFSVACVAGKQYLVQGVLSGDTGDINSIRLSTGGGDAIAYDASTGIISGAVTALAGTLEFLFNGTKGPSSIRIESLSIREDSFTPTAQGGWTSSDYSRGGTTPGLKGNGSTLYLDSNRNNNADGQDDNHNAVYITSVPTFPSSAYAGAGFDNAGTNVLGDLSDYTAHFRSRNSTLVNQGAATTGGLLGMSRSNSSQCTGRVNGASQVFSIASQTPYAGNVHVFARNAGTPSRTDARLAFYSIGSSLDLAALDARVSTLISSIAAALS